MADQPPTPPPPAPTPPSNTRMAHNQQSALLPSSIFSSPPSALSPTLPPLHEQQQPMINTISTASADPATKDDPGVQDSPGVETIAMAAGQENQNAVEPIAVEGGERRQRARSVDSAESLDWGYEDFDEEADRVGEAEVRGVPGEDSLADFSVDGYTIDLAMLGRGGQGRKVGFGSSRRSKPGTAPIRNPTQDARTAPSPLAEEKNKPNRTVCRSEVRGEVSHGNIVPGEEDDGPEDFTLNMGAWMRGHGIWNKSGGRIPDELGDSMLEPLGTSTPMPMRVQSTISQDAVQPSVQQQTTSLQSESTDRERDEEICVLRAEVESQQAREIEWRNSQEQLEIENDGLRKQNADLRTRVEEQGPLFSASATRLSSSSPGDARPKSREAERDSDAAAALASANERIPALESALRASHETVRRLQTEMAEKNETHTNLVEGLQQDLARLKGQLESEVSRNATLERDAKMAAEYILNADTVVSKMNAEAIVVAKKKEVSNAEFRETRRLMSVIEKENDSLKRQLDARLEAADTVERSLKASAKELSEANDTITKLREEVEQNITAKGTELEDVVTSKNHEAAIQTLVERHNKALSLLKTKQSRDLQRLANERASEIHRLEGDLSTANSKSQTAEEELRSAIRVLSSKLEKANAATRAAREDVEGAQTAATDAARRENEVVNAALERKFIESMEEREKEWRGRVELLLRDRDRMSKVLMSEWGRSEMGPPAVVRRQGEEGQIQAYKYRATITGPKAGVFPEAPGEISGADSWELFDLHSCLVERADGALQATGTTTTHERRRTRVGVDRSPKFEARSQWQKDSSSSLQPATTECMIPAVFSQPHGSILAGFSATFQLTLDTPHGPLVRAHADSLQNSLLS